MYICNNMLSITYRYTTLAACTYIQIYLFIEHLHIL